MWTARANLGSSVHALLRTRLQPRLPRLPAYFVYQSAELNPFMHTPQTVRDIVVRTACASPSRGGGDGRPGVETAECSGACNERDTRDEILAVQRSAERDREYRNGRVELPAIFSPAHTERLHVCGNHRFRLLANSRHHEFVQP